MRILQVVPYFFPAWAYGGPAKLVYDTSVFFADQNNQVTVYTSDAYDSERRMPRNKRINHKNITVHYFKNFHNALTYTYNIFFTPDTYISALVELKKFDVIHIHDFYTLQNAWIAFLAKLYNVPFILSVHGCLEEKRLAQRSLFKKWYLWLFGNWMLKNATKVVATSDNEVLAYQQHGVETSHIYRLGHGVNKEEFVTKLSKTASRKELKLPLSKVIITFLGRIHQIKGLDILVKAISHLKLKHVHFVIAGSDDGYLSELMRLIKQLKLKEQITILGTIFGETKAQLFKATDIFVYPSYSEGFSLGILEALTAGLPLVITTGCHFELVAEEKAGLIVSPDDKQLAAALYTVATDESLRKSMSARAVKLIENYFSMAKIGHDLLDLYQQSVQRTMKSEKKGART